MVSVRGLRLLALLLLTALPVLCWAQPPAGGPPPASGQAPPVQTAPPSQPPPQSPPLTQAPPSSTQAPGQAGTAPGTPPPPGSADPYLQYAQNVDVRISQVEVSGFPTVRAFVTATDENGVLLRTLQESNFTLTENGTPAADLHFGNRDELNLPLAIQFIVDVSGSMAVPLDDQGTTAVSLEVEAVKQFVSQLQPEDRVGLIVFSDAPIREVPLSTDKQLFLRALDQLSGWGQTTLYDGIMLGMEELLTDTAPARRALVVLSDGLDNKSIETPQTILQFYDDNAQQQNRGFSVYALGLGEEIDRVGLGHIATQTGGQYIDSPTAQDLAGVYESLLKQLQNEYLLEYSSPVESKPGQIIDIEVNLSGVASSVPGKYSYRSPGLTKALARAFWPGLIAISILLAVLIIATIYKISRRVWLTIMITPLEGKDVVIPQESADIGTLESCEVRVPGDPALLPVHATLKEQADGYLLQAVDPASPIMCGSSLLARKLLRSGDRFTLGYTTFVFNERRLRPGEGREELAEYYVRDITPQLTEQAQLSGAAPAGTGSQQHRPPTTLVGLSGPLAGQRFKLQPGENLIGRNEGSVRASDSQVSRRHALLTVEAGAVTLTDLGSTNGTRLNGALCQSGMKQPVYTGDTIDLGASAFRLE
jgi:VWFA-related protein